MKANSSFLRLQEIQDRKDAERKALQRPTVADFPAVPDPVEIPSSCGNLGTQSTQLGTQTTQLGTQSVGRLGTQSTQTTQNRLGTQQAEDQPVLTMPETAGKARWKDDREQLNLKLPQPLLERLRRHAFDNRLALKDAVIQAIEMLLGTQSTQGSLGSLGRNLPTLDDDFDDDDPRARETKAIVELYEKATGNIFNERDNEFLNQYRHFGANCLTLAILIGRNRSRQKINSLRFFEGNIREVAAWQPDKIERELPFQWSEFRKRIGRTTPKTPS